MYPCPAYDRAVWGIVVRCFRRWVVVLSNGRKGGLREYARQVGRAQPTVTEWVQAARVATITDRLTYQLFDLTTHLAAGWAGTENHNGMGKCCPGGEKPYAHA